MPREWIVSNQSVPAGRLCASTVPVLVPAGNELNLLLFIMNDGSVPLVPLTFTKLNIEHVK
jgi:hypothetical protein